MLKKNLDRLPAPAQPAPPPQQYEQQAPPQQYEQQPPPQQYQQPPPQQYPPQQQYPQQQYQQQPPPPQPQYEGSYQGRYEGASDGDYAGSRGDEGDNDDGGGDGWSPTGFSVRIDPLNWLIEGRLGFELELGIWEFLTFEMVPIFVANTEPPLFNFSGRDDPLSQHSNGLGPIAGTSLGLGFWLSGEPFKGYVLRAIFTNYGYRYEAADSAGVFDKVEHTERRLLGFIGSYSRFGFFTIGGGIELGVEMNEDERCDLGTASVNGQTVITPGMGGCDELHIALRRSATSIANLNDALHPVHLGFRFSLGVAFD